MKVLLIKIVGGKTFKADSWKDWFFVFLVVFLVILIDFMQARTQPYFINTYYLDLQYNKYINKMQNTWANVVKLDFLFWMNKSFGYKDHTAWQYNLKSIHLFPHDLQSLWSLYCKSWSSVQSFKNPIKINGTYHITYQRCRFWPSSTLSWFSFEHEWTVRWSVSFSSYPLTLCCCAVSHHTIITLATYQTKALRALL